jgi:hypothetical protein
MLELLKIEKVASVVASPKDDMSACWVVAESSKHFFTSVVSRRGDLGPFSRTLNFMVGPLFPLTDVNNTKQRLIDAETLREYSKFGRSADKANLC